MQAWGCNSGTLTGRHLALTQCITEESCFSETADHTAYSETAGQDTCRMGPGQQDTTQIIQPRGIRRVGTFMVAQGCSATYEVLEEQCPRNPVLNEQSLYVFLSSTTVRKFLRTLLQSIIGRPLTSSGNTDAVYCSNRTRSIGVDLPQSQKTATDGGSAPRHRSVTVVEKTYHTNAIQRGKSKRSMPLSLHTYVAYRHKLGANRH